MWRIFSFLSLFVLSGCETVGYYAQSVNGQWDVVKRERPVDQILAEPTTPERLLTQLKLAREIRQFAVEKLALPDNGSYREYADLERENVVWNVFAAPELSVQPRRWCFPVAGCVSYRGYFHQDDAEDYARRLRGEGDDVSVEGITAYSTLGWFDDPLLNTFLFRGDTELAAHLFHELAHQVVYVKNDTAFNESFATAVEMAGVQAWLDQRGDESALSHYQTRKQRSRRFIDLLLVTRKDLKKIYSDTSLSDHGKREQKQVTFERLRQRYTEMKAGWAGYSGFDRWFKPGLNNARFVPIGDYFRWQPAFEQLLADESGDFAAFYQRVRDLARLEPGERNARLQQLMRAGAVQSDT